PAREAPLLPGSQEEDVVHAGGRERSAAEVDAETIAAGHDGSAAAIDRHGVARVDVGAAEALCPERGAVRGVPRDEDVGPAGADQRTGAEVDRRLEDPGHRHLAARVHRDAPAGVIVDAARESRPQVGTRWGILRDEDILVREAPRPAPAEVDRV